MTKFGIMPIKVFNRMKSITSIEQVSNTISRVDNTKSDSWVKFFEYDEDKQVLTITFRDGFIAHYPNITKDEVTAFTEAESKGLFVRERLYNHKYY